jgi:hypothetical protein
LYLTDKMLLLPDTLSRSSDLLAETNVEILNWNWIDFVPSEFTENPSAGVLTTAQKTPADQSEWSFFDCREALSLKASGKVRRSHQLRDQYATGKVCFGTVSARLVHKIREHSGSLCLGATHDYAAMIQVLSSTSQGVFTRRPGMVFVNLPIDRSWGSRTALDSESAQAYYASFSHIDDVLEKLPVRGLYASQSNMVASDYERFLPRYGNQSLYDRRSWLLQMLLDLFEPGKTWISPSEKESQMSLLKDAVKCEPGLLWRFRFHRFIAKFRLERVWQKVGRAFRRIRGQSFIGLVSMKSSDRLLGAKFPLEIASPSEAVKVLSSVLNQNDSL